MGDKSLSPPKCRFFDSDFQTVKMERQNSQSMLIRQVNIQSSKSRSRLGSALNGQALQIVLSETSNSEDEMSYDSVQDEESKMKSNTQTQS